MPYNLPKSLTVDEWKKVKADLATDTGISDKLRKLAQAATAFQVDNDTSVRALRTKLTEVKTAALAQQKKLNAAFAKTKDYLGKLAKAAQDEDGKVAERVSDHEEQLRKKAADAKKLQEFDAREAIKTAASEGREKFLAALKNHAATLGITVGAQIKIKLAMENQKSDELKNLVKESTGIDLVVGQLLRLIKNL